jgi:cyclophilin family peptidyl-prolyl cis-trans isomerase/HEAT repeat protein
MAACAPEPGVTPPAVEAGLAGVEGGRPTDGLLENPRLMAVEEARHPVDVSALLAFLDDEDAAVRARAAFVLASVRWDVRGDAERIRSALMDPLRDPVAAVRRDAAFALGRRGGAGAGVDPPVEAALVALLDDLDPGVRIAAMEALGFRGAHRAAEVLLAAVPGTPAGRGGAEGGEETRARTLALARLALRAGPESEAVLVRRLGGALASDDPGVRSAAALYFAEAPDPQAWVGQLDAVRQGLDRSDEEDGTLVLLAQALAGHRDPGVRDFLVDQLARSPREALRLGAARGLNSTAYIESTGVREALLHAVVNDPSDAVALAAVAGLHRGLRVPAWVQEEALALLTRPDVPRVRQAAFLPLLAARTTYEPILAWTRARLGDDPPAAALGVHVLGAVPDPPVTPFLFEAADHPHPGVQDAAARALAGRWERILGPDEELLRYRELFGRLAREGMPGTATVAIRSLAHPVFAALEPELLLREAAAARAGSPGGEVLAHEFALALQAVDVGSALPRGGGSPTSAGVRPDLLRPLGPHPVLILEMEAGTLAVGLFPEEAPRAASLLVTRALGGLLDGVPFHRVIPGVLAQGGDVVAHDGTGRDGLEVPLEFTRRPFDRGALGVAGPGEPGQGMQFFLSGAASSDLDLGHGVLGILLAGSDILPRIREGDRIRQSCVVPHPGVGSPLPRCPGL